MTETKITFQELPTKFQKWKARMCNMILSFRFWLRWHIIGWPKLENGKKKIEKLGYVDNKTINFLTFTPFPVDPEHNWGVIRADMDSGFCPENSRLYPNTACFLTEGKEIEGYGNRVSGNPPKWLKRPARTGLAKSEPMPLVGVYSIVMDLQDDAIGEWPAWWLFMRNRKGEIGYYEIDMMERFYGKKSERNLLTTSMHFSNSHKDDGMMHNYSYRVKRHQLIHQSVEFCEDGTKKIYINGILVWKDKLFPASLVKDREVIMILGSGLQRNTYDNGTKELLPFMFSAEDLTHHTKPKMIKNIKI